MSSLRPYDWTRPPDENAPPPQPRPRGRAFRYVILVINVLFLIWLATSLGHDSSCIGLVGDELDACQTGEALGAGIAMFLIVGLWAFVDVILGVVYFVLRDRR